MNDGNVYYLQNVYLYFQNVCVSLKWLNVLFQGKPVDFFVLILEGHVEVTIGKENLTFESGPFTYFGLAAVAQTQSIGL